jgi:hypothetical protein
MRVFLDDIRSPKTENFDKIARSIEDFKSIIEVALLSNTKITYISFDHDLGECPDGLDCVKYLVEKDMDNDILSVDFEYNVHSANPVGSQDIFCYMKNYLIHKEREKANENKKNTKISK